MRVFPHSGATIAAIGSKHAGTRVAPDDAQPVDQRTGESDGRRYVMKKLAAGLAALLVVAAAQAPADARKVKVNQPLVPSGADADARGLARLVLLSASEGTFEVRVRRLARNASYQLIVDGTHVADIVTHGGGGGRERLGTRARSSHDRVLGFDPRGATIVVRSAGGEDVLRTDFPDDQPNDDGGVVCCIPDDKGPECEDRTPDECAAQGGTVIANATSCLPNPCEGAPPVDDAIICCVPDDSGPECEDRTQSECLAAGGTVVDATACTPNACAPTPPADREIVCCLPDDGGDRMNECEDRTAAACTAAGGTVSNAASCTPDPCNANPPPAGEIACCVPSSARGPSARIGHPRSARQRAVPPPRPGRACPTRVAGATAARAAADAAGADGVDRAPIEERRRVEAGRLR
jgi:hypothetical protein